MTDVTSKFHTYFANKKLPLLRFRVTNRDVRILESISGLYGKDIKAMSFPETYRRGVDNTSSSMISNRKHYYTTNLYKDSDWEVKPYWYNNNALVMHTDGVAGTLCGMLKGEYSISINIHDDCEVNHCKTPAMFVLTFILRQCNTYINAVTQLMRLRTTTPISAHVMSADGKMCLISIDSEDAFVLPILEANGALIDYSTSFDTPSASAARGDVLRERKTDNDFYDLVDERTAYTVCMDVAKGEMILS
jgi:hypothetical protein